MHTSVFLIHLNPAGSQTFISLEIYDSTSTFYLPDAPTSKLSVTRSQDAEHSAIRLDVEQNYCLLSRYSTESVISILLDDCEVELPISTATHQKSIIITESHQFITPASRWEIEFGTHGEIHDSMQPPLSPRDEAYDNMARYIELVPSVENGHLVDGNAMDDGYEVESVPVLVADIRLPPRNSVSPDSDQDQEQEQEVEETVITSIDSDPARHSKDMNDQDQVIADEHATHTEGSPNSTFDATQESLVEVESGAFENRQATAQPSQNLDRTKRRSDPSSTSQSAEADENRAIVEVDQMRVNEDTIACTSDAPSNKVLAASWSNDDEETESEDESQQQRDLRMPKRRLLEIEYEQGSLQRSKMRKVDSVEDQPTKKSHKISFDEPLDTIVVSTASGNGSPAPRDRANKSLKTAKQKSKSITKPKPNVELGLQVSKRVSATVSTPRRSSRQKADTPSSTTSTLFTNSDHRRPAVIFGSTSEFSADKRMKKIKTTIEKLGGIVVREIHDADVLVMGKGRLKKTSKFIIAIATGRDVVTDDWIKQACMDQKFPDREQFIPKDIQRETEWDFSLSEALKRGKTGLRLLGNTHVYLTNQLRVDLGNLNKELKQIALALGAAAVHAGLPKTRTDDDHKTLVIGSTQNVDPESATVERLGYKLYGQDVLTMGTLRGQIDVESEEFVIQVPIKDEPVGP